LFDTEKLATNGLDYFLAATAREKFLNIGTKSRALATAVDRPMILNLLLV
jgi:hypothetical protein